MDRPPRTILHRLALGAIVSIPALIPFFLGRVFIYRDLVEFFLPMKVFLHNRLMAGDLPLWDPYTYCGRPFFATLQSQVLYPPNLIACLLPMPLAFNLFAAFHLGMAAVGMHLWVRRLGMGNAAAWIAGLGYGLGGPLLATVEVSNNLSTMAWWPWIAWAASGLARTGGPRAFLALVLALAAAGLGGEPHMALFGGLLAVAVAFVLPAHEKSSAPTISKPRRFRLLALAGCLSVGLILVQVVPFLELVKNSDRIEGMESEIAEKHSATWKDMAGYFGSNRSNFSTSTDSLQAAQSTQGYLRLRYTGTVCLALALLGFLAALRGTDRALGKTALFGAGIWIVSWLLAFGSASPVFSLARMSGLLFGFRYPAKFLVPASLGLALVAAVGIELLVRTEHERMRKFALVLFPVVALGAALLALLGIGVGFVGAVILAVAALTLKIRPQIAGAALCTLLVVDLLAAHVGVLPTARASTLYSPTTVSKIAATRAQRIYTRPPSVEKLLAAWPEDDAEKDRMSTYARNRVIQLAGNVPMALGVRSVRGAATLVPSRIQKILQSADRGGADDQSRLAFFQLGTPYFYSYSKLPEDLFLGGNRLREADGYLYLYGEAGFKFYAVPEEFVVEHRKPADRHSPGTISFVQDPRYQPSWALRDFFPLDPGPAAREWMHDSDRRTYKSYLESAGYLVVRESWDSGWKAWVGGERTPVLLADHAFMAIPLPAGKQEVVLLYQPTSLKLGGAGSLLSLIALIAILLRLRRAQEE